MLGQTSKTEEKITSFWGFLDKKLDDFKKKYKMNWII